MSRQKLLCAIVLLFTALPSLALAQSAVFITQPPTIGNSGNTFFVFLPVANIGGGVATNMQLTSVALTLLGSPVTAVTQPASFPFAMGLEYLAPTGVLVLDLEFNNSKLIGGDRYLLTVRGTYQVNGTTFGFALNRPVVFAAGFAATHEQTLDVIALKFDSLSGIDRLADNQELLGFLSGLPQISAAGLSDPPSTVWATFADNGEQVLILNNFPLPPVLPSQPFLNNTAPRPVPVLNSPAAPSAPLIQLNTTAPPGSPTELPTSSQVRLLNALSPSFVNPVPDLHVWLVDKQGYSDPKGADATVEALRNVGGDGVLFIHSHAGVDKNQNIPFNVWTSTPTREYKDLDVSDPLQAALKDDIDKKRIKAMEAKDHKNFLTRKWVTVHHYGITAKFVNDHWSNFGANALVFINTCDSDKDDPTVQDFKDAIFVKLASVYVGWTDEVGDEFAANAAKLVFDRLLGADQFCPEDGQACHPGAAQPPAFAQRPFDYTQVEVDLPKHGLDKNGAAELKFEPNPHITTNFGLLAPSIGNLVTDITQDPPQLFMSGDFGSDPGPDGMVTVGGTPLSNLTWTPDTIQADFPTSLAGDVIVTVRQHKSNIAQMTRWEGDFISNTIGISSLKQKIAFHVIFRGDIRKFRPTIHLDPIEPTATMFAHSPGSTAPFRCSGAGSTSSPNRRDDYTWTGSGALVLRKPFVGSPPPNWFFFFNFLKQSHTLMNAQFSAFSNACTEDDKITFTNPPGTGHFVHALSLCFTDTNFTLNLNEGATIQAGTWPLPANQCGFPTGYSQGTLQWTTIPATPGTAPDPKSAR